MADMTFWTETTTRRVYSLPNPTNWVEVSKVLAAIRQDPDLPGEYDDSVMVEGTDEEIRFTFVVGSGPTRTSREAF